MIQFPAGTTIPACGYFLVQPASTVTGVLPVSPDYISGTINLSGSSGKIALTNAAPQALLNVLTQAEKKKGEVAEA